MPHTPPATTPARQQGFNLLELLLVVLIIAALISVAYPQYQKYIKQSRVADGRDRLLEVTSQLERCYSRDDGYQSCGIPLSQDSVQGFYEVTLDSDDFSPTTYTLIATAKQPEQVACSRLWIRHTGEKGGDGNACW